MKVKSPNTETTRELKDSDSDDYAFCCDHSPCTTRFKTKRQKLLHHNKIEKECSSEKIVLLSLLDKFNKTLEKLIIKYPKKPFQSLKAYEQIKDLYSLVLKLKVMDPEPVLSIMGDSFNLNTVTGMSKQSQ